MRNGVQGLGTAARRQVGWARGRVGGQYPGQCLIRCIHTPSLRGVNIQRLFGAQRALNIAEDFTELEHHAAYYDGIPAGTARKGTTVLERVSQPLAITAKRGLNQLRQRQV